MRHAGNEGNKKNTVHRRGARGAGDQGEGEGEGEVQAGYVAKLG